MGRASGREASSEASRVCKSSWVCLSETQGLDVREHNRGVGSVHRVVEMEWFLFVDITRVTEL